MRAAETNPLSKPASPDSWLTPGRFAALLALFVVATFPGVLLQGESFINRDFGLFGYPLAHFHRACFWRGELPLWDPLNRCGMPYLAQWNTLILYPPSLLYLLLPLPWSVSFFCLAHFFWGGLGMYFLAQRWTRHRLAASVAGTAFCFNGLALNFLMWPNVSAAFAWLPWVLLLVPAAWREGGRKLVWAALAASLQMLAASPEVILLTWVLLLGLAGIDWLRHEGPRRLIALHFCGVALLVALLCAAQLLPFLQLLMQSQRDTRFGAASDDWSMPIWGWANLLVPLFRETPSSQGLFSQNGQGWTSSYYAGVGVLFLAAIGIWRGRDWRVRLLAAVFFASLLLALGDTGLVYRAVRFVIPAIGFLRFPVKFVILALAVAPLLAAVGLASLTRDSQRHGRFEWGCALALLCLIGLLLALDWKLRVADEIWSVSWRYGLGRVAFLVLIFLLIIGLVRAQERVRMVFGLLLLAAFWLDGATHEPAQNPTVRSSVYQPGWARAQLKWADQPAVGQSRVMLGADAEEALRLHQLPNIEQGYLIERLSFLANCNLLDQVPQTLGFFSLIPREINNLTLLPLLKTNADYRALMDLMGVAYTTAPGTLCNWKQRPTAMPLVTAGQLPVFAEDAIAFGAVAQTNTDFRQLVFLPEAARSSITATQQPAARVCSSSFDSHAISVEAEAPGASMLVISQTWYPAWKAFVDGHPAKLWRANYAFQALQVPPGSHQIKLVYRDTAFRAGLVLSALGALACLALWWYNPKHGNLTSLQKAPETRP